jgi:chemotaxis protein MotB
VVFSPNWEFSAGRTSAVARLIIGLGFPKNRIKVMGKADTKPLVSNQDKDGRDISEHQARNCRVVFFVFSGK